MIIFKNFFDNVCIFIYMCGRTDKVFFQIGRMFRCPSRWYKSWASCRKTGHSFPYNYALTHRLQNNKVARASDLPDISHEKREHNYAEKKSERISLVTVEDSRRKFPFSPRDRLVGAAGKCRRRRRPYAGIKSSETLSRQSILTRNVVNKSLRTRL